MAESRIEYRSSGALPALLTRPITSLLDPAFDWFFCAFIAVTIFLPGGSIYGVNFKYPLYAGLLPLAACAIFRRKQTGTVQLTMLLAVPGIISGWMIVGLVHGFSVAAAFRQYFDILLTLLMCWLTAIYCDRQESRRLKFLRLILFTELATAVLKVGLIAFAVLRGIPVVQMVMWLDSVFGSGLMTMDLGSLFGRIQFISDELIPVCIYMLLRYRERLRISSFSASLMILVLVVCVLFSFSRYFWGFTVFAFILGLALGKRDKFQAVLIAVLGLAIVASLPALITLYQLRFSEKVTSGSDLGRNEQIPALEHFFISAPLFGHGLGSYTTENIRGAESQRASYEVQLLALPAQLGIAGVFFFVVLGGYYYRNLWWKSQLRLTDRLSLALLLAFWIAAGLTNPLLFHPVAGVNYATLATLAAMASAKTTSRTSPAK